MRINIRNYSFFLTGHAVFCLRLKLHFWERGTFTALDYYLKNNYSYIDIGAWIGPTAIYAAKIAKTVYAIEPDPNAFGLLENNLALNPDIANKVRTFNIAIWNENQNVSLFNQEKFGNSESTLIQNDGKSIIVKGMTLENFLSENKITDCNVIKIDIEGGEKNILPSIKNYIIVNKPTIIIALHTHLFKDKEKYLEEVCDVLKLYKFLYYTNRKRIDVKKIQTDALKTKYIPEIVATEIEWKH